MVKKIAKGVFAVIAWTIIGVLALAVSIFIHVRSAATKNFVQTLAQDLVAENVRGRLTIGSIERLTGRYVVINDVRIFDPSGREVIRASRVSARLNLGALTRGLIHIPEVTIDGAHLVLVRGEDELPTFIEAFSPRNPASDPTTPSPHVLVDRVIINRATAEGEVQGIAGIQIRDFRVRARFELQEELVLTIFEAQADMYAPYRPSVLVRSVKGTIDTDPTHGISLLVVADSGATDHIRANVAVHPAADDLPTSKTTVEILAHLNPLSVETVRGAGIEGLDTVRGSVRGYARLIGPVDNLHFDAALNHEAGDVRVDGRLSETQGFDVHAQTSGLNLDRAIEGVPAGMRIGGDARLHVATQTQDGPPPTFHAEVNAFAFDEWAVPSFTADGAIAPHEIRIDRVDAPYAGGEVHGSGRISTEDDGAIAIDIRARIPQIARDPNVHHLVPDARASLDATVHIETHQHGGGAQHVGVDGSVALRNVSYNAIEAQSIRARGELHLVGRTPTVRADVRAESLRLGGYDVGSGTVAVRGGPNRYTTVGRFETHDQRRADFDATITIRADDAIEIDAPRVELAIGDLVWRGLIQRMVIKPDQFIETQMLRLANGSQRLEARGRVAFRSSQNLDVVLQDFDISAINRIVPDLIRLRGHVDAHAVLGGTLAQPTVSVEGAYREGIIDRIEGIEAVYRVTYENGALEIDQQIDLGERGNLMLSGGGAISTQIANPIEAIQRGQYTLQLDIGDLDIAVARGYIPQKYQSLGARISGTINLEGSHDQPQLRLDTTVSAASMYGLPPFMLGITGTYTTALTEATVVLSQEDNALGRVDVRYESDVRDFVRGPNPIANALERHAWRLQANVPNQRSDELSPTLQALLRDYPVEGSLALVTQGGPEGFSAELSSRAIWHDDLSRLPCGQGAHPRVEVQAFVAQGQFRASAKGFLQSNESAFEMTAETAIDVDSWIRQMAVPATLPATTVDINLPNLDLGQVPLVCNRFSGPVRGTIHASDLFTDTHALRAVINSQGLQVHNGPATDFELVANVSTRALVADVALASPGTDSHAEIQATMEVDWPAPMPFPMVRADGRFLLLGRFEEAQVAPMLAMIPGIADAQLIVDGSLQAQGTRDELTWAGALALREGTIELIGPGQRLDHMSGALTFHSDRAVIESLHAEDIEGRIDVTGELVFRGIIPQSGDMRLHLNVFPIRRDGLVLATMTGRAHVAVAVSSAQTELRVGVQDLSIGLPDETGQAVQSLELNPDIVVIGEEREEVDPTQAYPFHVIIDADQPFWIRRSDFAAQVRANLDVTYRDPTLRVGGYVNLQRGFFEIFGKRFDLARGSLVFDNSFELNPTLDIVAVYTLPGGNARTVTVTVSGNLASPQIDFSTSEQTTDRGEIIALLLSGRTSISSQGSSASQADAQQQAASFVSGVLAGVLTLGLRRQLGEMFPIISIESGDTAFTSARVRVGFQVESFIRDNLPALSNVIQGAYFEGFAAVSSTDASNTTVTSSQGNAPAGALLELRFPHSIVFTGTVRYPGSWGVDFTIEP